MTFAKPNIVLLMQEAMTQLLERTNPGKQWEMNQGNNQGLSFDFLHGLEQSQDELHLLKMEVTEQELEIQVTIGPAIRSWVDVQSAIYRLLGLVAEQVLMVVQARDEVTYQFWFITGYINDRAPHGHFGVIALPLKDVEHLDPDEYE